MPACDPGIGPEAFRGSGEEVDTTQVFEVFSRTIGDVSFISAV